MRYDHVSVSIPRRSWGGRTFPSSNLPISFNQSSSWPHGGKSIQGEDGHGIKVALEPRTEWGRRRNKEDVIMDWTSLLMIETVVGFLGIFALHLFWKDQQW